MHRRIILCVGVMLAAGLASGPHAAVITVQQGGAVSTLSAALSQANNGDTINVIAGPADYVEGSQNIGQQNLTIQGISGTPRFARTGLAVFGSGLTIRNLILDGEREPSIEHVINLLGVSDVLVESCTIINPASGSAGTGDIGTLTAQAESTEWSTPGTCVRVSNCNSVTLRDCGFECTRNDNVQNEVNVIDFAPPESFTSNLLIENCRFGAQTRNVCLVGSHAGVILRGNAFNRTAATTGDRLGLSTYTTSAVCLLPYSPDTTSVVSGLVIRDNDFNSVSGVSINLWNGTINDGMIAGNSFDECFSCNLLVHCDGVVLTVRDNDFKMVRSANSSGTVIETALPDLVTREGAIDFITITDNHFLDANSNYLYLRDGDTEATVRGNVFESNPNWTHFPGGNDTELHFIDNIVNGGGTASGVQGCIGLAGDGQVVRGNVMRNHDGAVEFVRYGLPGSIAQESPGGFNIIADNIIAQMSVYGIFERDAYLADGRDEMFDFNRYFNNTLVLINGKAIDIHNDNVDVFNNLILQNQAGIAAADAAPLGVMDFNLVFANGPGGSANYVGLAVRGPHDINANPLLANIAGGDFSLLPGSPARNAGTNPAVDLSVTDFTTEIGAVQDENIDTRVPRSGWERYR